MSKRHVIVSDGHAAAGVAAGLQLGQVVSGGEGGEVLLGKTHQLVVADPWGGERDSSTPTMRLTQHLICTVLCSQGSIYCWGELAI